jgi:hypothetical protein
MSAEIIIIYWIVILCIFWYTYIKFRKTFYKDKKKKKVTYITNLILMTVGLLLILLIFNKINQLNPLNILLISLLGLNAYLHQLLLVFTANGINNNVINLIHGPVTHSLIFIIYGYLTFIGGFQLSNLVTSPIFQILLFICIASSLITSLAGLYEGFRWKKW